MQVFTANEGTLWKREKAEGKYYLSEEQLLMDLYASPALLYLGQELLRSKEVKKNIYVESHNKLLEFIDCFKIMKGTKKLIKSVKPCWKANNLPPLASSTETLKIRCKTFSGLLKQ